MEATGSTCGVVSAGRPTSSVHVAFSNHFLFLHVLHLGSVWQRSVTLFRQLKWHQQLLLQSPGDTVISGELDQRIAGHSCTCCVYRTWTVTRRLAGLYWRLALSATNNHVMQADQQRICVITVLQVH